MNHKSSRHPPIHFNIIVLSAPRSSIISPPGFPINIFYTFLISSCASRPAHPCIWKQSDGRIWEMTGSGLWITRNFCISLACFLYFLTLAQYIHHSSGQTTAFILWCKPHLSPDVSRKLHQSATVTLYVSACHNCTFRFLYIGCSEMKWVSSWPGISFRRQMKMFRPDGYKLI
jgi:hypothetical protein